MITDICDCCGTETVREESLREVLLDIRRMLYPTPEEIERSKRMEPMMRIAMDAMAHIAKNLYQENNEINTVGVTGDTITILKPQNYH